MKKNAQTTSATALLKLADDLEEIYKYAKAKYDLKQNFMWAQDPAMKEAMENMSLEKALGERYTCNPNEQKMLECVATYSDVYAFSDAAMRAQEILIALVNEPAIAAEIKATEVTESLIKDLFSAAHQLSCTDMRCYGGAPALLLTAKEAVHHARYSETFAELCIDIKESAYSASYGKLRHPYLIIKNKIKNTINTHKKKEKMKAKIAAQNQ